jgi:hypothetical protein
MQMAQTRGETLNPSGQLAFHQPENVEEVLTGSIGWSGVDGLEVGGVVDGEGGSEENKRHACLGQEGRAFCFGGQNIHHESKDEIF